MNGAHYRVFHGFLGRECVFALRSRDEMTSVLKVHFRSGMTAEESVKETNTFWSSVDSFLMATGNISKSFWPTKPPMPHKEKRVDGWEKHWKEGWDRNILRGKELRTILRIVDDSPFNKDSRKLRDHFEHFDERNGQMVLPDSDKRPNLRLEHSTEVSHGHNQIDDSNRERIPLFRPEHLDSDLSRRRNSTSIL